MLAWTGERFLPGVKGDIEIEHLHRYHAVAELVVGRRVLDIACGEGYGSGLLVARAASVVGVDVSEEAIAHARAKYTDSRLRFEVGSCLRIPLADASVDAVVCFETLEHVREHDETMREYVRVLAPGGFLCVSCPDKLEYSDLPRFNNAYHVRELYIEEFRDLLQRYFTNVDLYGQRVSYGSVLGPVGRSQAQMHSWRVADPVPARGVGVLRPVYLVAVASSAPCPVLPAGVFEPAVPAFVADLQSLNERLTKAASDVESLSQSIAKERLSLSAAEASARSTAEDLADARARHAQDLDIAAQRAAAAVARCSQADIEIQILLAQVAEAEQRAAAAVACSAQADIESQVLHSQIAAAEQREEMARRERIQFLESIRNLENTLSALRASRSWRLTRPIRFSGTLVRRAQPYVGRSVRALYRRLPLPVELKRRGKDLLFGRLPGVFGRTRAYREWRAFNAERGVARRELPAPAEVACAIGTTEVVLGTQALALPDGHWEWSDRERVAERIAAVESVRRAKVRVDAARVIRIEDCDLDGAISRLLFPTVSVPTVSIVLPVYGKLRYTVECLTALCRGTCRATFEVIIADDASTDGTADRLAGVRNLTVVPAESNRGFLLNVNGALSHTRGRYVLLLNNDVQVEPGCIDALVDAMNADPHAGAAGPLLLYPSGRLQEAGCALRADGTALMVGLDDDPAAPQYGYPRRVDYCSGACLLVDGALLRDIGGFDTRFAPAYCEDSDLCLQLRSRGRHVQYVPEARAVHHLSITTADGDNDRKLHQIGRNLDVFVRKWQPVLDKHERVRTIAFYLPQFHPFPENDLWWGAGFTEWRNVAKARPNFVGHDQPRIPADLGHYDLRLVDIMDQQAELARRYGVGGFCFYYYWFAGRRLLDMPIERMLATGRPDFPFCLCWANENWTRRWDGQDSEILMAQAHSEADDIAVIRDLMRYLRHPNYIRIDGRPLLLVYRVALFPNFADTASTWRRLCREEGIGEIYLAMVESFEMVFSGTDPLQFGCDAAVEFPPHGLAEPVAVPQPLLNPQFKGAVADYCDLAVRYGLREEPSYVRFRGVMPGWDNTARRQDQSFVIHQATPGAFQAWCERAFEQTRRMRSGDERIVFINAWNEWAEGAYLEPDRRHGHGFLEALRNAHDVSRLAGGSYVLG